METEYNQDSERQDSEQQVPQWQDEFPDTYEERAICGFWRRIAAFLIDSIILGFVGFFIGLIFYSALGKFNPWGILVGFFIAMMYFVPLNSSLGGGQTIGKRLMKIKVVNANGDYISPARSLVRYSVFAVPYFLNGAVLPDFVGSSMILSGLLALIVFGGGLSISYLYIFNVRTRQSLHDLLAGTYVIRKDAPENPELKGVWKGHWIAVCLIFYLAVLGLVAINYTAKRYTPFFEELQEVRTKLHETGKIYASAISSNTLYTRDRNGTAKAIGIVIVPDGTVDNDEDLADDMAKIVLDTYQRVGEYDYMNITIRRGFNIGIARSGYYRNFQHSMKEWADRMRSNET